MLSFFFLVFRVLSAESFSIKYENDYGYANSFDLIYTKNGIDYTTSQSGWAIAYRFYNNDTPGNKMDIQRNDNGVHKDGDITISLTSKEEPGPGFLTLNTGKYWK
ncbi:hypothetical protein TVAG_229700 [Trichomonas vaginalis G3]|uniref:Uncharacterized protein n=1 Tax=Trichomonas vaginalis (strain ATCC PRA-98 / G3) TaxID=412133 RepID=A2GGN0_TRIV3|nr:hypothetical protein TVAGG3_0196830 [Trichomonas vaginalis G3]EAX83686.1 hypothetical protein TVAG_229700 [Trichomonas vaginalis G3]KAI5550358.1 hypothetical protein TVAGG3_0196830 [Trichomonas vaginalis G3]|eukprot:XP_001296616.1 hypothetical protein [Trichomonas vaginalis G3]